MKVIGNAREIEWMKEALQNQCERCPYMESCNESAKQNQGLSGKVQHSCKEYLGEAIEFIMENDEES